ncbi:MAG TPA: TerB family tellurite resistance protein [Candidatus Nanopelagicales bacterium]|nr:TerB family tellurite resistance protein [Candidatus Nanopelagicales bacterium]
MLDKLSREERLQLMRFVCSFAWADLEIQPKERKFVEKLITKLGLNEEEQKLVRGWLEVPPEAEALDPQQIPRPHRQIFLDTARQMIAADGKIDPEEEESLRLLEQLTA